MLQRAASNAYSWWWASHIRTKQSKWMEQNLQDMEEKVQNVLKLIEEDGDSFARRAEMYYKKRPELINFVEESYRAYRALAERYDHISTELQNANNTIASVFPEQVQFSMDEEDEEAMPKVPKKPPEIPKTNIPKVPKAPITDLKSIITSATKKLKSKKTSKPATVTSIAKSGLSKPEALREIDKLQKQILTLQTEKEFMKSSYESGLAKYWEIENQIKEMQGRIFSLQDEFGEGMVIEDNEARNLMARAALKSCQESLAQLQEKQERTAEEGRIESTRIREVRERLESLKGESHGDETSQEKSHAEKEPPRQKEASDCLDQEVDSSAEENQRAEELRQKIKEHLESSTCLTMPEMAEKIDELVNKVISLETALSSQTALVKQLRSETDELQAQIRTLEDDKASIADGRNNLPQKLEEMEEKLGGIQDLNQKVENENSNLQTHFIVAHCNLDHLSERLPSIELDAELEPRSSLRTLVLKQPDKLPSAKVDASGPHTELEQPNEVLKAHQSCNDPKQMRSDEACQVTGSRQNEEPVTEMRSEKLLSSKEEESLNPEDKFEKANESGTTSNQENVGQTQVNSLDLESDSKESDVNGTVGNQVEVVGTEDNSLNLEDNYEKPGLNDAARSQEKIVHTQETSINMEGNSEKYDINSSASNPEVVQTKANAPYLECGSEKAEVSGTPRTQVEEICEQENLEHPSEKKKDVIEQDKEQKKTSSQKIGAIQHVEPEGQVMEKEDEPNWRRLFLSGMEDREKLLLTEYTTTLRNFKGVKKKLNEIDVKNRDYLLQTTKQMNELKSANALKDEEIRSLRHKLNLMQKCFYESKGVMDLNASDYHKTLKISGDQNPKPMRTMDNSNRSEILTNLISEEGETYDIIKLLAHQPATTSVIEERLRMKIDELLEENLDFWLKFSTSFHQIQKFDTGIQDLKSEVTKLQEKGKKLDESSSAKYSLKSEARPLYKHLREIQTELTVWLDKSAALKDELQSRFSSLCNIQEEITAGLKASAEDDDFAFTSYQAAKFQGEVLNMKQENNKVADELQAALDHIATLQLEVENNLSKLNEEFRLSGSRKQETPQLRHSESRNRVPLRSFIFGVKPKKQRPSIFSGMAPVMQRKYYALRTGSPL